MESNDLMKGATIAAIAVAIYIALRGINANTLPGASNIPALKPPQGTIPSNSCIILSTCSPPLAANYLAVSQPYTSAVSPITKIPAKKSVTCSPQISTKMIQKPVNSPVIGLRVRSCRVLSPKQKVSFSNPQAPGLQPYNNCFRANCCNYVHSAFPSPPLVECFRANCCNYVEYTRLCGSIAFHYCNPAGGCGPSGIVLSAWSDPYGNCPA